MFRRIPISLRFDDDDTDFYGNFIEEKKNNRELSTLILDLLHVYYENEIVQQILNEYVMDKNPYLKITEEIQRIALEHNRQSVATNMLSDYTQNEGKRIKSDSQTSKSTSTKTQSNDDVSEKEIPKSLPEKGLTATELMGLFKELLVTNKEEFKSLLFDDNQVSEKNEDIITSVAPKLEVVPEIVEKSIIEKPIIEKPIIEPFVEKAIVTAVSTPSDTGIKKPASFGKLLNSVK